MATEIDQSLSLSRLLNRTGTADPYPLYRRLQSEDPVHWDPEMHCWVLTGYDDVLAALRDTRLSSHRASVELSNVLAPDQQKRLEPIAQALSRMILFLDPPDHTHLRAFVNKAFSPRALEHLRSRVQEMVDRIVERAKQRGQMEVMRELAYPVPLTVIAEMLGVPEEDQYKLIEWSNDLGAFFGLAPLSQLETIEKLRGIGEFARYLSQIASQRRYQPRDDLMQTLVAAWEAQAIRQHELIGNCVLLLAAGHGTTTSLIGNGLLALLQHPDQMRQLRDDPGLINGAVTELLRHVSPVQGVVRRAAHKLDIGTKQIDRGDFVFLSLAAANRDPQQFPHPERLDIMRDGGKQISFGHGIHHCLGAALARIEAEVVFSTVLRRLPTTELESEALEWEGNIVFRRLRALPIHLTPGQPSRPPQNENVSSSRPATAAGEYSYRLLGSGETTPFEAMTFPKFRPMLARVGQDSTVVAVGSAAHGRPAGLALAEFWENGSGATVRSIYVEPEHRRRGVATNLLMGTEKALIERGCRAMAAIYMTGKPSTRAVERLLEKGSYGAPETRSVVAKLTAAALTTMPWTKRDELPSDFAIFPWSELTADDQQWIEESQKADPWIPEELVPSRYHLGLHHPTSLGLRYDGRVVGWLLSHQLDPTTLRFAAVWIRHDLQRVGRLVPLIPLVVEGGRRTVAAGFERVIWLTSAQHPLMMEFTRRWVAPYAAFYGETRARSKQLA